MREELEGKVRAFRRRIIERDGKRCAWCRLRLPVSALTLDHLVPRARWRPHWGNKHQDSNVVACCRDCGRIKGDVWIDGIGLTPGPGFRTVTVNWTTARYCFALLRASSPRRRHVPRLLGE